MWVLNARAPSLTLFGLAGGGGSGGGRWGCAGLEALRGLGDRLDGAQLLGLGVPLPQRGGPSGGQRGSLDGRGLAGRGLGRRGALFESPWGGGAVAGAMPVREGERELT